MYLLEETLDAIEESGHTTDDVLYVGSEDGRLQLPWGQAEPVLRVRYDNGYGDQAIATDLCVRFTDGAMLVRCEYDGAEWWRPIPAPAPQGDAFEALLRLVCKDVFELAAVDEASLDVAGGVGEAHGVAAQGLEPAVDGFGGSVA